MNKLARCNPPMKNGLLQLTSLADKIQQSPRSLVKPAFLTEENREAWFQTIISSYHQLQVDFYRAQMPKFKSSFCNELTVIIRFNLTPSSWSRIAYTLDEVAYSLDEAVALLFIMDSASRNNSIL